MICFGMKVRKGKNPAQSLNSDIQFFTMKPFLSACLLCFSLSSMAQMTTAFPDLFQQTAGWPRSGWVAGVGATYTLPVNQRLTDTTFGNIHGNRRVYSAPGIYAELGRFHLLPRGIIFNNLDYTIAYKEMNYRQEADGYTLTDSSYYTSDKASWKDRNISVSFNLNSIIQFADYQWIQPSLGIHGNYRLGGPTSYSSDPNFQYNVPDKINVQLHAKLAYGLKLTSELFIVPSIEIGLWRLNDLNKWKIPVHVFNSGYCPVIFSLKFLLHRPISMRPCDIKPEVIDLTKTKRSRKKPKLF